MKIYSNFYFYNFKESKISSKKLHEAKKFIESSPLKLEKNHKELDLLIYNFSKSNKFSYEPILCLRCRISFALFNEVNRIYQDNKENLEFFKIARIILIDDGNKYLRIKNTLGKGIRYEINYSFLEKIRDDEVLPLSLEILKSYDPKKSNLSTWSSRLIVGNKDFKNYMRSMGIKFEKIWSKIADSSTTKLQNALEFNGETNKKYIKNIINLHNSYKEQYRIAKKNYYEKKGTQLGWYPDIQFLKKLSPPQIDQFKLEEIGELLKRYEKGREQYIERQYYEDLNSIENVEVNTPINFKLFRDLINKCGSNIVKQLISQDQKKWIKDKQREKCWFLYGEGLSQREIAKNCEHKQAWVSKLLKENIMAELISNNIILELKTIPEFSNLDKNTNDLDNVKDKIRNHILKSEQQLSNNSFLRKWVKKELNQ